MEALVLEQKGKVVRKAPEAGPKPVQEGIILHQRPAHWSQQTDPPEQVSAFS